MKKDRIRAFEREWERERLARLRRERVYGNAALIVAAALFVAALGVTVGWW